MALKKLIDGQTITIDNHCRGAEFKWGKGVHLHKRMNRDKYSGAEVLIPIYDREEEKHELEFRKLKGENASQIKNEIESAFKDKGIRNRFIRSFFQALDEILEKEVLDEKQKIEVAKKAAIQIAALFGLKTKIKNYLKKEADRYYLKFSREEGVDFHVGVDLKEQNFIVGEDASEMQSFEII